MFYWYFEFPKFSKLIIFTIKSFIPQAYVIITMLSDIILSNDNEILVLHATCFIVIGFIIPSL